MSGSVFPKAVLDLKQFSCEFLVCHHFSCFSLFATEAELHMLVSLSGESNSSFTFILSSNSQDNASRKLLLSLNSRGKTSCKVLNFILLSPYTVFGAPQVALVVKKLPPMQKTQETCVQFLGREDPLE